MIDGFQESGSSFGTDKLSAADNLRKAIVRHHQGHQQQRKRHTQHPAGHIERHSDAVWPRRVHCGTEPIIELVLGGMNNAVPKRITSD